jgi:hypothetical protein
MVERSDAMDPVRILETIVKHLNETLVQEQQMLETDFEEIMPGDDDSPHNEAEVRLSWGGKDLFDLTIKRV